MPITKRKQETGCVSSFSDAKKKRATKHKLFDKLVEQDLKTLHQPLIPGRPIILYRTGTFVLLYNWTLEIIPNIPLRTIRTMRDDIHGNFQTEHSVDLSNLTSAQFCEFAKVLEAAEEGRSIVEQAEEEARVALFDADGEG